MKARNVLALLSYRVAIRRPLFQLVEHALDEIAPLVAHRPNSSGCLRFLYEGILDLVERLADCIGVVASCRQATAIKFRPPDIA